MRATLRSTLSLAALLAADLWCWAFHTHESFGPGRSGHALCPCGREWQGQLLRSREWRAIPEWSPEDELWRAEF